MNTAVANTPDARDEAVQQVPLAASRANPIDRVTRLLCARVYLYGALASVPAIFEITRPIFHARDPGIGYDQRFVLFHALQSLAVSLVLAIAAILVFRPLELPEGNEYGALGLAALALAFLKVGVFNPLVARICFSERSKRHGFRIPGLAPLVDLSARWLLPGSETEEANACYFAGDRPFSGYGTEISAWTLVIDTSAPAQSIHGFAGNSAEPAPLLPSDLYRAITGCLAALRVEHLDISWRSFLQGTAANEQRRNVDRRYARPPQSLNPQLVDHLDRDGNAGRRYLLLTMKRECQDLVATQFVRFHSNGKLMFCEFASYVLAPALRSVYRLDWFFGFHPLIYFLFGLALFALASILATTLVFGATVLLWSLGLVQGAAEYLNSPFAVLGDFARFATNPMEVLLSLSFVVLALLLIRLGWRAVRGILSTLGLAAGLTTQFGVAFSFRERFTSRGNLDYFCLQDVAQFMKTQEKLLVKAICDQLRAHGIDASDFKESLTAYINQGVINSGDIRGNVLSSVKGFVFRRPARSAGKRTAGRKAANG